MNHWESIVNIALCRSRWSLIISTCVCTKGETKRVHTGFPCCIPSVDLRHYCLVTCTIEHRKFNHHRLKLNSETKQTKEHRKLNFLGFLRFNESKRKEKSFWVFC